jgi:L,D-peptidoglycan transpeptidase YkuD (ErfK/YbiS/YcfS/YnhG family)
VALYDPYYSAWAANGMGAGMLGYPVTNERCTQSGSGCFQQFQRGYAAWVPGVGTTLLVGIYSSVWVNSGGESGRLGLPIAAEACGLVSSGCFQRFSGGNIYWNAGNGAFAVYGGYAQTWGQYGRETGRLGYPVSNERCGLSGPGCVQSFQGGYVYWASGIGFHSVYGVYGQMWGSKRAQNGALGYPVSEEYCQVSTCVQRFEGGSIQWTAGQGTSLRYSEWGYCRALNVGATKYSGGGATRVSFAVSQGYGTTPVTFTNCVKRDGKYVHEWTVAGYAGESGFARPGVATGPTTGKYSPTGSFSITLAFGLSNPGTSLPYQTLNPYSRWGGRLNANYNKYFESSADVFPDENMWYYATRPSGDYRQGAVINYNRPPDSNIVMDAGFAIFLHANPVPTWGCISLSESNVIKYLQTAGSGDRLIMGVSNDVFE